MYFKPLLLPLLAQIALTFIVMLIMYRKRVTEMKLKTNPSATDSNPLQIKGVADRLRVRRG